MNQQSQSGRITRRQVLRYGSGLAAGTATALAGCSSPLNSDSGPFELVEVQPGQVAVALTEDADVDTVRLRPPENGTPLNPTSIGSDQTSVELGLLRNTGGSGNPSGSLQAPSEGVFTVEAVRDEEVVAEQQTDSLTSGPRLTGVWAQTESGSGNRVTGRVLFSITTDGMLPTFLNHLSVTGVPNPFDEELPDISLAGTAVARQTQTDLPRNAKQLVAPRNDNTFVIDAPLQLSVDTYQQYVQMDTEYPELPEPCKTREWSGELGVRTGHGALTAPLTYSFAGETREVRSVMSGGGYMCSNASVSADVNTSSANASGGNASSTNASVNNSSQ